MEEEKTFSVGEKKAFFGIPAKCAVTAGQMICIFLMVLSLGILMILANIGVSLEDIGSSKKYTDTADCASQMFGYMADVSGRLREARRFEKDGVLNEELQIDITNLEALRESTAILDEYEVNPDTAYTLRQLQLLYNDDGAYELSDLYDRYEQTDFGTEGYSGYDGYYYSRLSKEYLDDEGTDYARQEVEAAVAAALRTDGKDVFSQMVQLQSVRRHLLNMVWYVIRKKKRKSMQSLSVLQIQRLNLQNKFRNCQEKV